MPTTKPGWRDVIAASRQEYLDNQLRAAVRSHPEVAVERLRSMGYVIQQPEP